MKKMIAPSLLSADFSRLSEQIAEAEKAGADVFHVDVMDGHFVPNLTFGPIIVKAINKLTDLPLHVHLMISDPSKYAEEFIKAGADWLSFHIEAVPEPAPVIEMIRSLGCKPALAINPPTPFGLIKQYLPSLDLLLVMTVNPGFGGQGFIADAVTKIGQAVRARQEARASYIIEVDGGITDETAPEASAQGAEMFVAGSYIFGSADIAEAVRKLRSAIENN